MEICISETNFYCGEANFSEIKFDWKQCLRKLEKCFQMVETSDRVPLFIDHEKHVDFRKMLWHSQGLSGFQNFYTSINNSNRTFLKSNFDLLPTNIIRFQGALNSKPSLLSFTFTLHYQIVRSPGNTAHTDNTTETTN